MFRQWNFNSKSWVNNNIGNPLVFANSAQESFRSAVGKMWLELWVSTATACVPHQALLWNLHRGQTEEETIRSPLSHLLCISLFWETDVFNGRCSFSEAQGSGFTLCATCQHNFVVLKRLSSDALLHFSHGKRAKRKHKLLCLTGIRNMSWT